MKKDMFELNPSVSCIKDSDEKYIIGSNIFRQYIIEMDPLVKDIIAGFKQPATKETVREHLLTKYCPDDIDSIIEQLIDNEVVTRCIHMQSESSGTYQDLYDRQIRLFNSLTCQNGLVCDERLKKARVTLIGLGGTGSYVLYTLAAMGIGYVRAIDFDRVETSNLSRQILYTEGDIGKLKIDCAKNRIKELNSRLDYDYINLFVDSEEKIINLIKDVDLCILSADTPRRKIQHMVNRCSIKTNTPYVVSGSNLDSISVGPFVIPNETGCLACFVGDSFESDHDTVVSSFNDGYVSTLIDPYNALAASHVALEAIKYLSGFDEPVTKNKVIMQDLSTLENKFFDFKKEQYCPICSHE